jgi:hypothetical protein
MKKSDIAMIVLIASIFILIAFFATKAIFGDSANETVKVKTIESINSTIEEPSTDIFNSNGINPTYRVNVGTEDSSTSDITQPEPEE